MLELNYDLFEELGLGEFAKTETEERAEKYIERKKILTLSTMSQEVLERLLSKAYINKIMLMKGTFSELRGPCRCIHMTWENRDVKFRSGNRKFPLSIKGPIVKIKIIETIEDL